MPAYVSLQRDDVHTLAARYGLDITSYTPLAGGASNTSFVLCTTHQQFILTIFDDKSGDEVTRIARASGVLEAHAFPAPRLIATTNGALTTAFDDHFVILKSYVEGDVHADLSPSQLEQIGATLARLHLIPPPDFLLDTYPYGYQHFLAASHANLDPEYEAWLAERHAYFVARLPAELPRGLLHADLAYDNVLFDNDALVTVLDFEDVCHYFLVFDVAMAIRGLCAVGTTLDLDKTQAFLRGYQQLRPLQASEADSLRLWIDYAATCLSYWRFWKYRIQHTIAERANFHWELAHFADHVRAIPDDQWHR